MWVKEIAIKGPRNSREPIAPIEFEEMPSLIMLFGSSDELEADNALSKINAQFADTLIVGCSTGTSIFAKSANDTGICGMAFGFNDTNIEYAIGSVKELSQSFELGEKLGHDLQKEDLVAVFILCDGLFINGSEIINGISNVLGHQIPISGGLAGDGERFAKTRVFLGDKIIENGAIAIGFYSKTLRVSHASFGGWYEFGPEWEITKSEGSIVYEIEEMPAIELYDDYVGSDKMALQASALLYPLKVWPKGEPEKGVVRAVMNIDRENGTLTFAGDVPQGWQARLMHGNQRGLIDGATKAADHAMHNLRIGTQNLHPEVCLIVSCVARRILLGSRTHQEIEAVSNIIGCETPMAGFYSYGEISPQNDSPQTGLHNQTMTLTLMTEAA